MVPSDASTKKGSASKLTVAVGRSQFIVDGAPQFLAWLLTRGYPQVLLFFFFFFCHGDLPNLLLASPQQASWKGNRELIKAEVTGFRKPVSEGAPHRVCHILSSRRNLRVQPVLSGRGEHKGVNRETGIIEGHLRSYLPPSLCLCFLSLSLKLKTKKIRDFSGGPVVKNPSCNAGDEGLIFGRN